MGDNKDFDKQQKPQAGQEQQGVGGGRKNNEEVGEPVQLQEDMKQGQKQGQQQQDKPGMGQQQQGGQHQGGQR